MMHCELSEKKKFYKMLVIYIQGKKVIPIYEIQEEGK